MDFSNNHQPLTDNKKLIIKNGTQMARILRMDMDFFDKG
jgi:hypothetical protein